MAHGVGSLVTQQATQCLSAYTGLYILSYAREVEMDAIEQKGYEFLDLLKIRTIDQIHNSDIIESCTATLLLIFAAIDALSKITCDDKLYEDYKLHHRGCKERFEHYLSEHMRGRYDTFKTQIYDLRCDIVHTGIGTKVILSKNQDDTRHLEQKDDCLWINTRRFLDDFKNSIKEVEKRVHRGSDYHINAQKRLSEMNMIELDGPHEPPAPSRGPRGDIFS